MGTIRIPLPPPPMAALTITGYVIDDELIHSSASEGVEKASSDPLIIGTLALMANSFADVLSPNVLLYCFVCDEL